MIKDKELKQNRPKWEVANIIESHIDEYQRKFGMPTSHHKVVQDILNCRTSILGGHIEKCNECEFERNSYNSCRNRHCPKCQTMAKETWLEARKAELLPVPYFHNVFTLPHEINSVALCNKKVTYTILFKSVSETLKQFGKNPINRLEGDIGFISILHTWDQKLLGHLHLHCVIPGGALSFDKSQWIPCPDNFLFPVKALSLVFRAKFIHFFEQAFEKGDLVFPGKIKLYGTQSGFKKLLNQLWSKDWVVYSKKPFAGPEKVLEYLARYTHRVAISNHRIISLENGKVSFAYRDRKSDSIKVMTIEAVEFIRRFLLHVLPEGFMRIRHFGIFANRCKKENIMTCRKLMGLPLELPEVFERTVQEMMLELTGKDITLCPVCKKGKMEIIGEIPNSLSGYRNKAMERIVIKNST